MLGHGLSHGSREILFIRFHGVGPFNSAISCQFHVACYDAF